MSNVVDIWEKITFDGTGKATNWQVSYDEGKSWSPDPALALWGQPPFVLIAPTGEEFSFITGRRD